MSCTSLVEPDCPVPRAHQRLEDAHRLWHQTAASYTDPSDFREGLNETVKALRGGTWALQQATRGGQEFSEWHAAWHRRIRDDEVLSWLVQTHRHSVSQADLEEASTAQVTLAADANGTPLAQFSVPPFVDPALIPQQLRDTRMGPVVKEASLMLLERSWAAGDLRSWELLDGLAHCWAVLSEPLAQAHSRNSEFSTQNSDKEGAVPEPNSKFQIPNSFPLCMIMPRQARTSVFRLHEGRIVKDHQAVGDELQGERPAANVATAKDAGDDDKPDPLRRVAWQFEEARRALTAQGTYQQCIALYVGDQWVSAELSSTDLQDRYQMWSRIAGEVERSGADAVLTIFAEGGRRSGEAQRLVLAGESADGQHRTLSAAFERRPNQVRFGRTRVDHDGRRWYFLDPVREVWRKQK